MATVEKITIALPAEMAGFVRRAVDAGEYASTSEAIRDLLGYIIEELRGLVAAGIASGPSAWMTIADVKAEARRRFEASGHDA